MFGKIAEAIDADEGLSSSDKLELKEQLKKAATDEIDPREEVNLFRRIREKLGQPAWNFITPILQNILTAYAKKELGV